MKTLESRGSGRGLWAGRAMAEPRVAAVRLVSGRLMAAIAVVAGMMVVGLVVSGVAEGWRQAMWSAPVVAGSVVVAVYGWWRWREQVRRP